MKKVVPEKVFISAPVTDTDCGCMICPHMAKNTLFKLYKCLLQRDPCIEIEKRGSNIKTLATYV